MRLEPIMVDIDTTEEVYAGEYYQNLFIIYPDYYNKIGYHPPWIGYFVMRNNEVVGVCGYVEQPKNGGVEIAYGTKKEYEYLHNKTILLHRGSVDQRVC